MGDGEGSAAQQQQAQQQQLGAIAGVVDTYAADLQALEVRVDSLRGATTSSEHGDEEEEQTAAEEGVGATSSDDGDDGDDDAEAMLMISDEDALRMGAATIIQARHRGNVARGVVVQQR
eukprot:COSAG01_NODE_14655_length_1425_cov_1.470588_2_plen_119_part_00